MFVRREDISQFVYDGECVDKSDGYHRSHPAAEEQRAKTEDEEARMHVQQGFGRNQVVADCTFGLRIGNEPICHFSALVRRDVKCHSEGDSLTTMLTYFRIKEGKTDRTRRINFVSATTRRVHNKPDLLSILEGCANSPQILRGTAGPK